MRVTREAELGTADLDELLQRVGDLLRIAHDRQSRAAAHGAQSAPQVRRDPVVVVLRFVRQLPHAAIGLRLAAPVLAHLALTVGRALDQAVGCRPGLFLRLAHADLESHTEGDLGPAKAVRAALDVGHLDRGRLGRVAPEKIAIGVLRAHIAGGV